MAVVVMWLFIKKCELCPFKEGALKRTDNGGWAHVVCALYIPEVRFGNVTTMEPIKMSSVPHERFLKTCYICEEAGRDSKTSNGACMSCNKPGCKLNFHVTCAQAKRMLCEEAGHYGNVQYVGYCSQHWAKKFGSRNQSEPERKSKEKKRSRLDSVSSNDGNGPKQKKKEKSMNSVPSKTADLVTSSDNGGKKHPDMEFTISSLARAGSAEKSAAESLNMLQQMAGAKDYFANSNGPKTPLNSFISPEIAQSNCNSKFNMANILSSHKGKSIKKQGYDEFVDVETFGSVGSVSETGKDKDAQKSDDKHKSASVYGDKCSTQQGKKQASSSIKTGLHPKNALSDAKKRKAATSDVEKALKRKKVDEKRKAKRKLDKQKSSVLPRPSKMNLYEDNRIPSLFPRNLGDKNPESFQDLLEFQWNQGAQFLIQKATHYDVGSLLSCLYQLRAENDDLEKRLEQLSARRDRLIAATTRLSTPLSESTDTERPVPLSAMLAKLKSDPGDTKPFAKERAVPKSRDSSHELSNSSPIPSKSSSLKKGKPVNGSGQANGGKNGNHFSDASLEDLDCKEVLSEDNSLNTPPKDLKSSKPTKKEQKQRSELLDGERVQNGGQPQLQSPLVQPSISNPIDSHVVGSITTGHCSQSPADFIHQLMRQQKNQSNYAAHPNRPPSQLIDFMNGQTNIIGNFKVDVPTSQARDNKSTSKHS
ncbi:protein AF-10-like isoform X2 [Rhopilema esculentum]|uniref:protein AF-10-like isoform X2 n=1 Tax=Rhopilema esculentum TaxID=499914 RepID=UPI0031D04481